MLGLYQFIQLTFDERKKVLWDEGQFLANVVMDETAYSLYSLFDFYVEVTLLEDEILDVKPFKTGETFDKYLPPINIDEIKYVIPSHENNNLPLIPSHLFLVSNGSLS
jgi:hypothetical protein